MDWKHPGSARTNKFKGSYLLAKYFCDCSAVLLVDILEYERAVNTDKQCVTPKNLARGHQEKRRCFLSVGVILLHDNLRLSRHGTCFRISIGKLWNIPLGQDLSLID
jgi:hypothetical protein